MTLMLIKFDWLLRLKFHILNAISYVRFNMERLLLYAKKLPRFFITVSDLYSDNPTRS